MSEITDLVVTAAGGNIAMAVLLVGLYVADVLQTRYFGERLDAVEERVERTETYLMERRGPAIADGGDADDREADD